MQEFEEYIRQGEPNKSEKAKVWKMAIGLQDVDGLKPSEYLIQTAKKNIEGDISIDEVKQLIDSYYQENPQSEGTNRTEEADKVSVRITEILSEQTFNFSPAEYISIHKRLFHGIYEYAGEYRKYNITKKEWVLDGETVLYASAENLKETLDYDFNREKNFTYKGLSSKDIIEHLASFVQDIWQIHIFGEGNTRTTAIFLIKYLRKLGFKSVDNKLFETHSWYFRNALVRANYEDLSKGIYRTSSFLVEFLSNLLYGTDFRLLNRAMHINYSDTVKAANEPVNDTVFSVIKLNANSTASEIADKLGVSLSTVKRKLKKLKEENRIRREGSDKNGCWVIIK